jgi:hypothetical protein
MTAAGTKLVLWTPEEVARLRQLFADGNGPSAIAKLMGKTRNAVIGRLNRMGLRCGADVAKGSRQQAQRKRRKAQRGDKPPAQVRKPAPKPAQAPPLRLPGVWALPAAGHPAGPVSISDLGARQCRYIGERPVLLTLDTPVYCGQPTDGGSWCPHHRSRVFDKRAARTA